MAHPTGFEPVIPGFVDQCLIQFGHGCVKARYYLDIQGRPQPEYPGFTHYNSRMQKDEKFHGWRLLGIIFLVVVALAIVSFVVDWVVIGPLEGRAF